MIQKPLKCKQAPDISAKMFWSINKLFKCKQIAYSNTKTFWRADIKIPVGHFYWITKNELTTVNNFHNVDDVIKCLNLES